jgi:hypothetical protein
LSVNTITDYSQVIGSTTTDVATLTSAHDSASSTVTYALLDASSSDSAYTGTKVTISSGKVVVADTSSKFSVDLKIEMTYQGGIYKTSAFTVAVTCPTLVVDPDVSSYPPFNISFTYPATSGGALIDVLTLSNFHNTVTCAITYSLVDSSGIALTGTSIVIDSATSSKITVDTDIEVS